MLRLSISRLLLAVLLCAAVFLVQSAVARSTLQKAAGDFVTVQGNQLIYKGKPVKLKGLNFYPKDQPWDQMWKRWRGEDARQDLSRARELGVNVLRILVPFQPDTGWTSKTTGEVTPRYLDQLHQVVQMAGELDMKVMIALFDFYDPEEDNWQPGSKAEERQLIYLRTIINAFRDDDRVMAWDLHNEPDNYATWRDEKNPKRVIEWMARMAAEIRRLDPNHLVTVGMAQFDHLFVADNTGSPYLEEPNRGLTPADLSDFLSFHSYNAGNMDWQLHYIKTRSPKPIVLQETGWPSGPPCQTPDYNEERQVALYSIMAEKAHKFDISGVLWWQLWDHPLSSGRETHEEFFGLLRRNGTWKPVMSLFRDGWPGPQAVVGAPPLPSLTRSAYALTNAPIPTPGPTDPNYVPPLWFPETGHSLHAPFREYWRRFGGLEVFGYPLTEQRKEGQYWVQYFERVRMEHHDQAFKQFPDWENMERTVRLRHMIKLTRLGVDRVNKNTGGKGYPKADPLKLPPGATLFPETGHSISGRMAEYWRTHEGITNFGYPLSEEVVEISETDGKPYTVQYFERTRIELHPEHAGTPYEVLLGQMGRELLASKGCK
jgi:hypothetical protein